MVLTAIVLSKEKRMRCDKILCIWSCLWIWGLGRISSWENNFCSISIEWLKMKVCKYNEKTSGKEHILNCIWWRMFKLLIRNKLQGTMSIKGSKSKRLSCEIQLVINIDRRRLKQRISDQKLLGGEIVEHSAETI